MNHSKSLLARVSFAVFVSLFIVSPVCTMFLQLCSTKWIIGTILVALLVFVLTGRWSSAQTNTSRDEHAMGQSSHQTARTPKTSGPVQQVF